VKKEKSTGKIVAFMIAGWLIIAGIFSVVQEYKILREFRRQTETRPLDLSVDLSQPGTFTVPFKQSWRTCCRQTIDLHIPPHALAKHLPSELLASLDFTWQITDTDGSVVADKESAGQPDWDKGPYEGMIPLAYFRPFALGDYTFSCTVVTGAPALAGLEQRLVCRYRPCGLETLPALFCCIIGIASFAAAGIILLVVLIVTKRKKRGQTTASSGTESEDKHEA
jgi:hypothetical protein